MILRYAQSNDAKELFLLENRLFKEENYPLSLASFRYHIRHNFLYVAEVEEKIVGYVLVLIKRKTAKLYSIGIDEEFRGKGISTKLIIAALDKVAMLGFEKIVLEVRIDNKSALALYKKFGFQTIKQEVHFYRDGCDAYIMSLDLNL
ncbi:ribosomal protein S18-alanine N-acetyltransferase [Sulfurimonas sp. C5]|uniref:ribosomal protein S18-alanine N-acetyltransferase n=1 Tax=Sulfurimonas sp. C5 TaxID=3036947 RepID=UPI0024587B5B|nr:ribosomal protein S18-alanine N-acetyltransferase [Sulfurimonas sp. C5]MDH4944982.1 ribosomal protein S18-alanine N-acetyltransferase [Sulfurimonas sp. C5]